MRTPNRAVRVAKMPVAFGASTAGNWLSSITHRECEYGDRERPHCPRRLSRFGVGRPGKRGKTFRGLARAMLRPSSERAQKGAMRRFYDFLKRKATRSLTSRTRYGAAPEPEERRSRPPPPFQRTAGRAPRCRTLYSVVVVEFRAVQPMSVPRRSRFLVITTRPPVA